MKIAIMTYLHAFNYGAELQAFALQRKLRDLSYNVTVLDVYRPKNKEYINGDGYKNVYSYKDKVSIRSKINFFCTLMLSKLLNRFYLNRFETREKRFYQFHEKYTNLSQKKYYNFNELYSSKLDYTHFVVGSDQVWNFEYPYSVEPYFLTFVEDNVKKISYAASIGHKELPEKVQKLYKKWLVGFSAISLREKDGVDLIQPLVDIDVKHVLDPSLLLNKEDWISSFNINCQKESKYVLLYLLSYSPNSIKLARMVAGKLNAKIVIIENKVWTNYVFEKNINVEYCAGPKEFVELFVNASFVITNSFHGTAFSLNINIPFVSTPRRNKKTNSRFVSLLNKVNLIDRLIYDDGKIPENIEVDFTYSNKILDIERENSISFLVNALK